MGCLERSSTCRPDYPSVAHCSRLFPVVVCPRPVPLHASQSVDFPGAFPPEVLAPDSPCHTLVPSHQFCDYGSRGDSLFYGGSVSRHSSDFSTESCSRL